MNILDALFMTWKELQAELYVVISTPAAQRRARVKAAKRVARLRRDVHVQYLARATKGLVAPCLCVVPDNEHACVGCPRIKQ